MPHFSCIFSPQPATQKEKQKAFFLTSTLFSRTKQRKKSFVLFHSKTKQGSIPITKREKGGVGTWEKEFVSSWESFSSLIFPPPCSFLFLALLPLSLLRFMLVSVPSSSTSSLVSSSSMGWKPSVWLFDPSVPCFPFSFECLHFTIKTLIIFYKSQGWWAPWLDVSWSHLSIYVKQYFYVSQKRVVIENTLLTERPSTSVVAVLGSRRVFVSYQNLDNRLKKLLKRPRLSFIISSTWINFLIL